MKRTEGIFKYALAVAFLLVAITAPIATACEEDCEFLCDISDLPVGFRELRVTSCRLGINLKSSDLTVDGPPAVGCTAICNNCTTKNPTLRMSSHACNNSYPEATIHEFCHDTPGGLPSPPIYFTPGRYYLLGGGGSQSASCEIEDACSGVKSYRNMLPITFYFSFTITRTKFAWHGPFDADPDDPPQSNWDWRGCYTEETRYASQSAAWISAQVDEPLCTADEIAACVVVGAIFNCGSEN